MRVWGGIYLGIPYPLSLILQAWACTVWSIISRIILIKYEKFWAMELWGSWSLWVGRTFPCNFISWLVSESSYTQVHADFDSVGWAGRVTVHAVQEWQHPGGHPALTKGREAAAHCGCQLSGVSFCSVFWFFSACSIAVTSNAPIFSKAHCQEALGILTCARAWVSWKSKLCALMSDRIFVCIR